RLDEVLDLHLFEFERAEDEVARRDLVPERLSNLRNTEGKLSPHRRGDIEEIDENALRRFWRQIGDIFLVFNRTDLRPEHGVEHAGLAQLTPAVGTLRRFDLVGPEAALTFAQTLHQRIVELFDVAAGDPHSWAGNERSVDQLHIVAQLDVGAQPGIA